MEFFIDRYVDMFVVCMHRLWTELIVLVRRK